MRFSLSISMPPRTEASRILGALRARQAQTLAEIRRFQRAARHESGRAAPQGLLENIVGQLRAIFADEECFLRAITHPNYYEHRHAHQRLLAELVADCRSLAGGDRPHHVQIAHLFDSYLIHQVTTTDFDLREFPRDLRSLAGTAFSVPGTAETVLATPGARVLQTMGVTQ